MTEHLRPVAETPLRLRNGRLQQQYVVTRYDPEKPGRQISQDVEWRYVEEGK